MAGSPEFMRAIRGRRYDGSPTLRDVAGKAFVSVGTVKAVLNGHPKVSPELTALVRVALADLNYQRVQG